MTIETNPPAFPRPSTDHGSYGSPGQDGMTLRDYFAAAAIPAVIAAMQGGIIAEHPIAGGGPAGFAASAYDIADAMLTARKGPDHGRG